MGYCQEANSKFKTSGWRLAYIQEDTPYLISAGSTDCITITPTSTASGYVESTSSESSNWTNSNDTYKFCKNYSFDSNTGKFTLDTSDCKSVAATVMSGNTMFQGYKYSCNSNTETTCSTMYEFAHNFTSLSYKTHTAVANGGSNFSSSNGIKHINSLNASALKYCNPSYAYGGVCNSDSAWNINATDFQMITGKTLSNSSCYTQNEDTNCGYNNDLIDNGGYYWYANLYNSNGSSLLLWIGDSRMVGAFGQTYAYGARPVLRLDSKISITGGSGTKSDPYTISN